MISNDVNVIFAYLDLTHINHKDSFLYVRKNKRREHINLFTVNNTFLSTYSDYIKDVGTIIEREIVLFKKQRDCDLRLKAPTSTALVKIIEFNIKKQLKKLADETTYFFEGLNSFKDLLLSNFSIPELYFENDKIGDFREMFILKAREVAINNLNIFLNNFSKSNLMKLSYYNSYDDFFEKLDDLKDFEDRKICAELYCYGMEKGVINFLTFDSEFKSFSNK